MTVDLDRIRKRLVEQVGQHCGVTPYAYAPAKVVPPCIFIGSLTRSPAAMGGAMDLECKLYGFVKAGGDSHMAELDDLVLGEKSMADAIDADPTLGGLAGVQVTYDEAGDYALHEWAGGPFWGVMLDLTIMLD